MENKDNKKIVQLAADIGYNLLKAGAEVYRVEQSVCFICYAYGYKTVDTFVIPATLIVTVQAEEEIITITKRLHRQEVNLEKMDRLNTLSRYLCQYKPNVKEAFHLLNHITQTPAYSKITQVFLFAFVSFFFTLFFDATILDACIAFFSGAVMKLTMIFIERHDTNPFFLNAISSASAALVAQTAAYLNLTAHTNVIILSALMNLVPGVAITNGIRDFINGDLYGGLSKMVESLLIATAVALGAAVILLCLPTVNEAVVKNEYTFIIEIISAFFASYAFAMAFGIRKKKNLIISSIGAMFGWIAYLLGLTFDMHSLTAYIFAGFSISLFSEIAARIFKSPVTIFLIIAFIPLVPGGAAYQTMEYCILGNHSLAMETGFHMLAISGCIVLGVFIAGSFFRYFITSVNGKNKMKGKKKQ